MGGERWDSLSSSSVPRWLCGATVGALVFIALAVAWSGGPFNWVRWNALDWSARFSSADDDTAPAYRHVHYRIDRPDRLGGPPGLLSIREEAWADREFGPVGQISLTGTFSHWKDTGIHLLRLVFLGPSDDRSWSELGQATPMWSYRIREVQFEYLCSSHEFREIQTRYQSASGHQAVDRVAHYQASSGWRSVPWHAFVDGLLAAHEVRLSPASALWPVICGEVHISEQLLRAHERAVASAQHVIYVPFPEHIDFPRNHPEFSIPFMDICAEAVDDTATRFGGGHVCALWKPGDATERLGLFLPPGSYRFFQQIHAGWSFEECGSVLGDYRADGACGQRDRAYWLSTSGSDQPVKVHLHDLGPGLSLGPTMRAFTWPERR